MENILIKFMIVCGLKTQVESLPHIIFIVADDLGWYDVGFHGAGDIKTPNIDALAYTGLILNRYYVTPLCTPSRSALMTGKYPIHTGMQHGVIMGSEPWGLPLNEKILPEYLQDVGYKNYIVGKWHLGHYMKKYTPIYRGFINHTGYWTGHHDYFDHTAVEWPNWGMDMRRNLDPAWDLHGQYSTDVFTQESVKIIESHNESEPLFLYLAHAAVHSANPYNPLPVPDKYVNKFNYIKDYKRQRFAAMLNKLDDSVGSIVNALYKKSMMQNSLIIFTTDNGGPADGFNDNSASNFPLRGVKNTYWEGGVRGTGFLWSPSILHPGRVYDGKMHIVDWLPTILGIINSTNSVSSQIDGMDMWDSFNEKISSPRQMILHNIDDIYGVAAITLNDWKLIKGTTYQGSWDGWYGASSWKENYNINEVIESPAGKVVKSLGFQLDLPTIDQLRFESRIDCGMINSTLSKCRPLNSSCLFNIRLDPCEFNNLAEEQYKILLTLENLLIQLNQTAITPRKVAPDPRANPSLWDHTWNNFGDFNYLSSISDVI